jgi:two-component system NarL family response regulator
MGSAERIRIVVADDHSIVREGLSAILGRQADMEVVGEAGTGSEAVDLVRALEPDVVLMDLRMPDMNGVEAIACIHKEQPDCGIVVLTVYDGDQEIVRALQAGARAYLLKDTFREDLLEAVRAVHAGQRRIPPEVARRLAEYVANPGLTARELDVLRLMARGRTNQEIGRSLFITESTVKGHVNSILGKLAVRDRTQAVTTALRRGIVTLEPRD